MDAPSLPANFDTPTLPASAGASRLVTRFLLSAVPPPMAPVTGGERHADDLWLFESAPDALQAALSLQQHESSAIGLHPGECLLGAAQPRPLDAASALTRALAGAATPGQILVSEAAFSDLVDCLPDDAPWASSLTWRAHGRYQFDAQVEPISVLEVATQGSVSQRAPDDSDSLRRLPDDGLIPGWRAAAGQEVPARPGWRLLRRLGIGGFGEAWLGGHAGSGEQRVFKFCYHEARLVSLKREVALFRLLQKNVEDHPGILPLLDWHLDSAPHFLESPLVAGGDLRQWCRARGGASAVPFAERIEIAAQMAEALAAAHAVGVLHKDIKPSNVLLEGPEHGLRVRLADFGVGAITDELRAEAAQMTMVGGGSRSALFGGTSLLGGTPMYMAPELFEGRTPTIHADAYAVGVVLFQLAVGDLNRALGSRWEDEVDSPSLRGDIAALVERDPQRRRTDLAQIAVDLRRLPQRDAALEEARIAAGRAERSRRLRRLLVPALVGALLLAVVLAGMVRRISAEAERANAEAARANAEATRANREAATTREVTEFFVDLFKIANPDESRGAAVTVREVLDRGAERVDTELAEQPRVRAELLNVIGNVYRQLGLFSAATPMVERALAVQREIGATGDELAGTLNRLAALHGDAGRYAQAVPLLEESIAMMEREGLQEQSKFGDALSILGSIYNDMGDREHAGPVLERTVAWREKHLPAGDPGIAIAVNNYGFHRLQIGDYRGASDLFDRALAIRRASLGEEHSETAISWNNVASVRRLRGDLAGAEEGFRQATAIWEATLGDQHAFTTVGWHNLANLARLRGEFDRAREFATRSLAVRRASYGNDHPWVANGLVELGLIESALGDHAAAETAVREAIALRAQRSGDDSKDVALARVALSEVLLAGGKTAAALAAAESGATHLRALLAEVAESADDPTLRQDVAAALLQWGLCLARSSRREEAAALWEEGLQTIDGVEREDRLIRVVQLRARLLAALGRIDEAQALRQQLIDSGHADTLLEQLVGANSDRD